MKKQHEDAVFEFPTGKVKLDASTPMPLHVGLDLVRMANFEHYNPHRQENVIGAHLADQAYKDREAERKRILLGAWAPIVRAVSAAMITIAGSGAVFVYRLT